MNTRPRTIPVGARGAAEWRSVRAEWRNAEVAAARIKIHPAACQVQRNGCLGAAFRRHVSEQRERPREVFPGLAVREQIVGVPSRHGEVVDGLGRLPAELEMASQ